ncbi:MAG: YabP/YqfC family sporulation protein [Oscillospiraceae bacterium]|nr:YabP/YqfC family sporulation protein [Oscillospiraceae bacterium]
MRGVTDVIDLAAERLEIPTFGLHGLPRLTLTGNRQLLVEQHRGLTRYSSDVIELALQKGRIRIEGNNLRLVAMDKEAVLIAGEIKGLEYLEN